MVTVKKVTLSDLDTLLAISRDTFFDFFGPVNHHDHMNAYAAVAFTPQKILAEFNNSNSEFYFAMVNDEVAGYLKLNFNDAQTEFKEADGLEIERIYVRRAHHGNGIGKLLLKFAVDIAIERQLNNVWLGVWEHNDNAIGFYEHNGFKAFSSHEFMLGDDKQTDILMKLSLPCKV